MQKELQLLFWYIVCFDCFCFESLRDEALTTETRFIVGRCDKPITEHSFRR